MPEQSFHYIVWIANFYKLDCFVLTMWRILTTWVFTDLVSLIGEFRRHAAPLLSFPFSFKCFETTATTATTTKKNKLFHTAWRQYVCLHRVFNLVLRRFSIWKRQISFFMNSFFCCRANGLTRTYIIFSFVSHFCPSMVPNKKERKHMQVNSVRWIRVGWCAGQQVSGVEWRLCLMILKWISTHPRDNLLGKLLWAIFGGICIHQLNVLLFKIDARTSARINLPGNILIEVLAGVGCLHSRGNTCVHGTYLLTALLRLTILFIRWGNWIPWRVFYALYRSGKKEERMNCIISFIVNLGIKVRGRKKYSWVIGVRFVCISSPRKYFTFPDFLK